MKNKIKNLFQVAFSLYLFVIFTKVVLAAPSSGTDGLPGMDLTIQSVFGIITGLACWASRLAMILMIVFIVYYGLLFLNARGDSKKYEDAKKSFRYGIIGIIVILGTYTIIATIANFFGASASWTPLSC